MALFLQALATGVPLGLVYALSALGFTLVFRASSALNFAHGGLAAGGAFIFLTLSVWTGLPIIPAFLVTLACCSALGILVERLFLGGLRRRNGTHATIALLGLALMFRGLLAFTFGRAEYTLSGLLPGSVSLDLGNTAISSGQVVVCVMASVTIVLFGLFYKYSSQGIFMRSALDSGQAAVSVGIHARKGAALSWAIAGLICAMTGIFLSLTGKVSIHSLNSTGLKMIPVMIIGGLGTMRGAVFAGLFIGLLETFTGIFISQSLGGVIPYVLLLLIVAARSAAPACRGKQQEKPAWGVGVTYEDQ